MIKPERKIKILHLIESIGRGGAEYNLLNMLKYMPKDSFYNKVLYLYDKEDSLSEDFIRAGIDTKCINMKNIYDFGRGLSGIVREIKKGNYDMVHTQLFGGNLYGRLGAFLARKKVVTTLQNPDYTFEGNLFRKILDKITTYITKTKFIAVSKFVKQSFIKELSLNPKDIEVIENSLDLERFKPIDYKSEEVREKILGCKQYILSIGRLHSQKGHIYLIKAFKRLAEKVKEVNLTLIGDGPLKDELISLTKELGIENRVHFLGIIKDVLPYLKGASIFVFPSLYEGLPLALLEAMAAGTSCVASNIPPIKEIEQDTGAILLAEPKDIASLENALLKLLEDEELRKKMIRTAFEIVNERFNVRKNSTKLEEYFIKIIDKT